MARVAARNVDGKRAHRGERERENGVHMCAEEFVKMRGGFPSPSLSPSFSFSLSLSLSFIVYFPSFSLVLLWVRVHTHTHISALARTRAHPQCIQYSRLSSSLVFDPHLSRSADPGNLLCRDRASIDS